MELIVIIPIMFLIITVILPVPVHIIRWLIGYAKINEFEFFNADEYKQSMVGGLVLWIVGWLVAYAVGIVYAAINWIFF